MDKNRISVYIGCIIMFFTFLLLGKHFVDQQQLPTVVFADDIAKVPAYNKYFDSVNYYGCKIRCDESGTWETQFLKARLFRYVDSVTKYKPSSAFFAYERKHHLVDEKACPCDLLNYSGSDSIIYVSDVKKQDYNLLVDSAKIDTIRHVAELPGQITMTSGALIMAEDGVIEFDGKHYWKYVHGKRIPWRVFRATILTAHSLQLPLGVRKVNQSFPAIYRDSCGVKNRVYACDSSAALYLTTQNSATRVYTMDSAYRFLLDSILFKDTVKIYKQ